MIQNRYKCSARFILLFFSLLLCVFPQFTFASEGSANLIDSSIGYFSLGLFVLAYILVILEEKAHLPKSTPMVCAAGIIWLVIAYYYSSIGKSSESQEALKHLLLEFAELMLFLIVAMTYINALHDRNVFEALRAKLVKMKLKNKGIFWFTGFLAFFISPIADNLTTALILSAVVLSVSQDSKFISLALTNIVVAANAGGVFSPFGDITSLLIWQAGKLEFFHFFQLFLPSLINFLVPAALMSLFLPNLNICAVNLEAEILPGGLKIILLFILTILTSVLVHASFHMPPVFGMMIGLGYLKILNYYNYISTERGRKKYTQKRDWEARDVNLGAIQVKQEFGNFNIFKSIAGSEWDTLLFFFGVILAVGGLGFIGYLSVAADMLYNDLGPTIANVSIGFLSALVDNIPVMFAVLNMDPEMTQQQWLLVTLTSGTGGSLLSIGSAAGVALMGQARGSYSFLSHFKWSPFILIGYIMSVLSVFFLFT